jgi:hypothetical protein
MRIGENYGIKKGKYEHFKGGVYKVLGVAHHHEDLEVFVIYQGIDEKVWIRPISMFTEMVSNPKEYSAQRFTRLPNWYERFIKFIGH